MTTAVATQVTERQVIIALARIYAVRYLRHPLYILGVLLLSGSLVQAYLQPDKAGSDWDGIGLSTGMYIGILGVIVGYRLAATEGRAAAVLPSLPANHRVRTLGLLVACLVPAATVAVFIGLHAIVNQISPGTDVYPFSLRPSDGSIGWVAYIAALAEDVVAGFGGPALGVAAASWLRFPGAGILVAVGLFLVEIVALAIGEGGIDAWDSWWAQGFNNAMPWVYWGVDLAGDGVYDVKRPGSPTGHLVYSLGLCGLAVTAAVLKDATADAKAVWTRRGGVFLGIAAVGFLWTMSG